MEVAMEAAPATVGEQAKHNVAGGNNRKRPASDDKPKQKNINSNRQLADAIPASSNRNGDASSNPQRKVQTPKKMKLDDNQANNSTSKQQQQQKSGESSEAAKKQEDKKMRKEHFNSRYRYGNFDRYYGTRLVKGEKDPRLAIFDKDWFYKKNVLDIGCNVGFLTLDIAKNFEPRRILGIDIDDHLIGVARKNIRHYCDQQTEMSGKFPASFSSHLGPVSSTPLSFTTSFPDNVWFRKENYVLDNEALLDMVSREYDVILALSITKWIHLNFGDDGMRLFFRRAFKQLRPGGRFILEPQPFSTYRKRANMTETTKKNYWSIEFKPEDFEMYLLLEVGFERVEHLGCPPNTKSKGFERCIDMYVKKGIYTREDPAEKPENEETDGKQKEEQQESVMEEKEQH